MCGFLPLGVPTVTSVKLQVAIEKYGYQHIGTTEKIAVISLMKTSGKMSRFWQHNSIILAHRESQ